MGVPINYWAVIAAAVVQFVLGALWYGPLFGKPWARMMGFTRDSMEAAKKKGMGKSYALMFVGSLLMSYVLAHAIVFGVEYTGTGGAVGGATAGFYYWLGFVVPITIGSVLWEGKRWKLWGINVGYYFVSLILMGMILGNWM